MEGTDIIAFLGWLQQSIVTWGNAFLNFELIPDWDFRVWHILIIPVIYGICSWIAGFFLGVDI